MSLAFPSETVCRILFVHDMSINAKPGESINANHSVVNGYHCTITGNHNTINGSSNNVSGNHNIINGFRNNVKGNHNTVYGDNNDIKGIRNNVRGGNNNTSSLSSNGPIKTISKIPGGGSVFIQRGDGVTTLNVGGAIGSISGGFSGTIDGGIVVNGGSMDGVAVATRSPSAHRTVNVNSGIGVIYGNNVSTHWGGDDGIRLNQSSPIQPKPEDLIDKLPEHKDEKADTPEMECAICMDNKRAISFLPCSHSTWCHSCVKPLIKDNKLECPTCRENVTGFAKFIF